MPSIESQRDAVPEWVVRETGQILIIIDHAGTEYFSQISTLEKKREISDVYFDGELSFTVSSYRFVAHVAHDAIYGCRCISPDPAPEFVVRRAEWFRREFIRLVNYPRLKPWACGYVRRTCHDGRVDNSPCRDVHGSYVVCGASESTRTTDERVSVGTVGSMNETTIRTGLRGIGRIDEYHGYSDEPRFVLDELSELIESPGIQAATLSLRSRFPVTDALEILKGDAASGVFGFRHQMLGDTMIDVSAKTGGSPGQMFKMPLCALRPRTLESTPEFFAPLAGVVDRLSGMDGTIRINSYVDDAKIHTKESFRINRVTLGNVKCQVEIEDSVSVDQVGLSSDSTDACLLVGSENHRNENPTADSHERDRFQPLKRHDSGVVDHGALGLECRFDRLVPLVCFGNLRDSPDGQLCRESVFLSDGVVDMLLKFDLVRRVQLECGFRDLVACGVELVRGLEKEFRLLGRRGEFDRQHQFHVLLLNINGIKSCGIPPTTKVAGFLPRGS